MDQLPLPNLKNKIRQRLKRHRASLDQAYILNHSISLSNQLKQLSIIKHAKHIGFYMPFKGEINVHFFIQSTWAKYKSYYLPVLPKNHSSALSFARVYHQTALRKNQFDILEPALSLTNHRSAMLLDVVLCPLVAFDTLGHRLGMGAGFYDRTFAFKQSLNRKPWLVGVAYDFQECAYVPHHPRDVSLDAIVTPTRTIIT